MESGVVNAKVITHYYLTAKGFALETFHVHIWYISVDTHECTHKQVYVYMYVCMYKHLYTCTYVCMYACTVDIKKYLVLKIL